jgi:F420-0:gamma-glutamyl ligase
MKTSLYNCNTTDALLPTRVPSVGCKGTSIPIVLIKNEGLLHVDHQKKQEQLKELKEDFIESILKAFLRF